MGRIAIASVTLLCLVLSGCAGNTHFDYAEAVTPMARFNDAPPTTSIAILPFVDVRAMHNSSADVYGSYLWGFVPLLPAGFAGSAYPEKLPRFVSLDNFEFMPEEDLTGAAHRSLAYSGLFNTAVRADSIEAANTDWVLRGMLTQTGYSGSCISYCVTYVFSPVFWALGAPYAASANELTLDFQLIDRRDSSIAWSHSYHGRETKVQWLYSGLGEDASMYAELVRRAINSALFDLSKQLPSLIQNRPGK